MTEQGLNTNKHDRYKASSFRAFNWRMRDSFDSLYWLRVFRVRDWDQAIANELRPLLTSSPVLDVGCASGRLLEFLAKRGGSQLCGVDIAPRMLEIAREKLAPLGVHHDLRTADVEETLPWADSFFGAAVLSCVIHHFYRPRDALAQIHRVLRPGGCLVVAEPEFPFGIRQTLNGYLRVFPHDGDFHFYSPNQLSCLLASCGFESVGATQHPGRFSYMIVFAKNIPKNGFAQPCAPPNGGRATSVENWKATDGALSAS